MPFDVFPTKFWVGKMIRYTTQANMIESQSHVIDLYLLAHVGIISFRSYLHISNIVSPHSTTKYACEKLKICTLFLNTLR